MFCDCDRQLWWSFLADVSSAFRTDETAVSIQAVNREIYVIHSPNGCFPDLIKCVIVQESRILVNCLFNASQW